jgi:ABC-2 type transport system permease protein
LPSRNFTELLSKEWRELWSSRSFWLLLMMTGPLVGQGFISAVGLYGEASGAGGGAAALAQGLTPLDGILVPTFGAYDLAATFLFPFVVIRMVSAEKESGALKLLLQLPGGLGAKLAAKGLALLCGWMLALLPGLLALALWGAYGGHLYAPETLNLLLGHLLRALVSGGFAVAAAALAESTASAAIVTLGVTVGTWALDFVAAGRGGLLRQLADYTPTAALRAFEQGLLRAGTLAAMLAIGVAGFAWAGVWLHTGWSLRRRACASALLLAALAVALAVAAALRPSWDLSENRRNSFPEADEEALAHVEGRLRVTAYLSPEDPRLTDLEQSVLVKLRRTMSEVEVDYAAGSRTGLFENPEEHYGEIWYEMDGRRNMERSTIEPVVLEQIYKLARVAPPARARREEFAGYPLPARPAWAALIFYGLWPAAVALAWWLERRRRDAT